MLLRRDDVPLWSSCCLTLRARMWDDAWGKWRLWSSISWSSPSCQCKHTHTHTHTHTNTNTNTNTHRYECSLLVTLWLTTDTHQVDFVFFSFFWEGGDYRDDDVFVVGWEMPVAAVVVDIAAVVGINLGRQPHKEPTHKSARDGKDWKQKTENIQKRGGKTQQTQDNG